jgi:hypothetical protein
VALWSALAGVGGVIGNLGGGLAVEFGEVEVQTFLPCEVIGGS